MAEIRYVTILILYFPHYLLAYQDLRNKSYCLLYIKVLRVLLLAKRLLRYP